MRETVRSLRTYFALAGVWAGVLSVQYLLQFGQISTQLGGAAGLVLAAAFVYCAVRLPRLLEASPEVVVRWLAISALASVLSLVRGVLAGRAVAGFVSAAIGLLITWYLYANVRRLANEARNAARPPA